jgi:uncharacterized protein
MWKIRTLSPVALVLVCCALSILAGAQQQSSQVDPAKQAEIERREYFLAHYTKYEYRIPMRDGVHLFTAVYAPKDSSQTWPILMLRTPYSVRPYGPDNYRDMGTSFDKFVREGFIFVFQDVRGRLRSEGEFVHARPHIPIKSGHNAVDESTDSYDTIDWLVKNIPGNSGKVGIWGISYPGFYAAMASIDAHPALKAASPQAPIADWFMGDDWRHHGAFFLAHGYGFLSSFGNPHIEPGQVPEPWVSGYQRPTPDGYDFFLDLGPLRNINPAIFNREAAYWRELHEHDRYDDYWKARNIRPHLKNIQPAVMTVGGWFDAEDVFGPFAVYHAVEKQSPGARNTLVVGPWSHGGWMGDGDRLGHVRFSAKTAEYFRDQVMLPFFLHHLKDKNDPKLPEALVFETGTNQWRRHDEWPPVQAHSRTFYFDAKGKLSATAPAAATGASGFDEYVSDPNKPVPATDEIAPGMTYSYMTSDQRFAARRPDVLAYETAPLEEDVTIAGPIECLLHVSTSGTDSDFVVKLIDRYPGDYPDPDPNPEKVKMAGYQQLLRGEPFRGRFRNSFEKPEAFTPGQVSKIAFSMPDVYHTFRRGHRIVVHIQSSWFPVVDRNPQKFVRIHEATEVDFQRATQRVYRSGSTASAITLRVLR